MDELLPKMVSVHCLTSEAVQSAALPLQGIHHIHGGHSLSLGVLGVGDGITDHILQEDLQHPTGLLVDQTGDTLHSATASQTANSGFGDSLDVITENFTVTLGASFAESLSSFSSSTHFRVLFGRWVALKRAVVLLVYQQQSLLGAGVLGHGLGALRHRVFSQLSGQQQADSGLDLPGGDGGALVVVSQTRGLTGDALKNVAHEAVHDAHGLGGDAVLLAVLETAFFEPFLGALTLAASGMING
ncbi:hypothetical protein F7725_022517 [Dissostichus mawsoni]|uniref:Uncharacterized protein n=1 Tax=Dissostichus mawsoni TaxID=36200 RepID=A0A7J5YY10_DISMA|nr:hypothetical protein F7725_022517 [Dissostichus mawsoni]